MNELFCLFLINLFKLQYIRFRDSDQDGGVRGCGTHLSPTNTSKIHLPNEKFSLKTKGKLGERLLYNSDYKKGTCRIR